MLPPEMRDVAQNERGIRIRMDRARDAKLTVFGKATLTDRYLMPGESFQDLFARVAMHFAADTAHAQRLYADRKSVVEGKGVSVRVDLGGRRIIKKNTRKRTA